MSITMMVSIHTPVLLEEVIETLHVQPGKRYVDCTLGTGGHSEAILKRVAGFWVSMRTWMRLK